MSISDGTPPHWNRFVDLIKQHAPISPMGVQSDSQLNRAQAGRAASVLQTLVAGTGGSLPGPVGTAIDVVTTSSIEDLATSTADGSITAGAAAVTVAEAGPLAGGLIMLLRGAYQSLGRGDQMVRYLLGTTGYVTTLARACTDAMREGHHYTLMPMPVIPTYVRRTTELHTDGRVEAYHDGYRRVRLVLNRIDELRPSSTAGNRDHFSKRCLLHVAIQTGRRGGRAEDNWRIRTACERIILREFLATDMQRAATSLRRWSNSA